MTTAVSALAACSYADTATMLTAEIVAHKQIADNTYRLRLDCPEIAAKARPGQFVMLRIPERTDPLLARPLAIYDTFSLPVFKIRTNPLQVQPNVFSAHQTHAPHRYADFVYAVHGKFTTALKDLTPGSSAVVWGPLGNGFQIPAVNHLLLVAGGIGQTALLALGRQHMGAAAYGMPLLAVPQAQAVTFCWGARHGGLFGDVDDFREAGIDVHLATLDGSIGHKGTVIDLLDNLFASGVPPTNDSIHIACCGPEGMMAAVSHWSSARQLPCDVSLEAPMACGIGICFTCVAKVRDASGAWDYRRTCIEGPIFDANRIEW